MKPHTRIIYYTLLCLALNHRRSRASIYGGAEQETSSVYACFLVFVCVLIWVHVCVYVHGYVFIWRMDVNMYIYA